MNTPEDILNSGRLARPSQDLDRRLKALLAEPVRARRRPAVIWGFGAVLATAAALTVAVIVSGRRAAPLPPVSAVYDVSQQTVVRDWLLNIPQDPPPLGLGAGTPGHS